jgi:hypothetical protein
MQPTSGTRVFCVHMQHTSGTRVFCVRMQRTSGPRVVGLSLPPRRGAGQLRGVTAYGLEELDHTLHARVRTAFEDRQAGYVNEVRWQFVFKCEVRIYMLDCQMVW